MPQKGDSGDFILSEYGTWNVASDYSKLKIMQPLILCDQYETIATFGFTDFTEEIFSNINIDVLKIRGFKRLIKTLILLIDNSKFVIKGEDKKLLIKYRKELERYYKVIPALHEIISNQKEKTKEIKIIEEKYIPALERVVEIKSLINEPLNKYDLIFTHKEEFDAKKYKEKIKQDAKTKG